MTPISALSSWKTLSSGLSQQEWRLCSIVLGFNAVLALGILALKIITGINLTLLVRDVAFIADLPAYAGAYHFVAILIYAAGAAISLFVAALYPHDEVQPVRRLLVIGGGYAAFACVDDLFMLHENGLFIGLPELVVKAIHAAILAWMAYRALRLGSRTPWTILVASIGIMGLAMMMDNPLYRVPGQTTIEEVFETVGVSLLTSYLALTAYRLLASRLSQRPSVPDRTELSSAPVAQIRPKNLWRVPAYLSWAAAFLTVAVTIGYGLLRHQATTDVPIDLQQVPRHVMEAANTTDAMGVTFTAAEIEGNIYELSGAMASGMLYKIDVRNTGEIEEIEWQVDISDLPGVVTTALEGIMPGFSANSIWRSWRPGKLSIYYEFEGTYEGRIIDAEIKEDGSEFHNKVNSGSIDEGGVDDVAAP